jgi:hypothetical protein
MAFSSLSKVSRNLLLGQAVLFGFMSACYLMLPNLLVGGAGASNFGDSWPTIIPYSLGLVGCALFVFLAAELLGASSWLKLPLYVLAAGYAAELLSTYPYKLNPTFNQLHKATDVAFVLYQLLLGLLCIWYLYRKHLAVVIFAGQLAGALLMFLSLFSYHVLFAGQVLESLAFAIMLVTATAGLSDKSKRIAEFDTSNIRLKT